MGVWIGGVWNGHFPESEKYVSEPEICRKIPEIPQKERFLPDFRLRNLKIQSPKKCNSIPPAIPYPTRLPPINFPQNYISVTRNIFREFISRKLHIKYSFVILRITWKNCLVIIFLENLISVTCNHVFGINFATISGWSVLFWAHLKGE